MREIGTELKQERISQNLSIAEVSERTRFSVAQLVALEEGNLDYFKDDIPYVRFFVQNYCKVLQLDFSRFKSEFDDSMMTYANLLSLKEIEELNKVNENIKKKVHLHNKLNANHKKKKKIDFSVLSLLAISTVMVIGLFVIMSQYVIPSLMNATPKVTTKPPLIEDIDPSEDVTTSTSTSKEIPTSILNVSQLSNSEFEVSGFKEGDSIKIGITFRHRTWIDVSVDGVSFKTPVSKIYSPEEKVVYDVVAKRGSIVSLNLGYFDTNEFFINDQPIVMSEALAKLKSGRIVRFNLKGE